MAQPQVDFKQSEEKIRKFWEKEKIYSFDVKSKKKIYSIDTPPPTVSGKMHLGHAFSYSQQDFIVRFRRMFGNVFYPFGTDDNGLPTERLVEKLKKVKSKNMSRADFIELCLETLKEITPDFIQDWKNLGVSCDYDLCYSTIDENSRKISQKSFIDLFKKNKIYKKKFPTLWCCECQTSIAQAELEDREEKSLFSTLKFRVDNQDLLISTTRPELLGACVAVFVNPKDKRYKKFVGKKAKVPLFDLEVPILEDKSADMNKGTGVLMICSYGDRFDLDAVHRFKLKPNVVLNKDGKLNIGNYDGLTVREARKQILDDLKAKGLIENQQEINHVVNTHDKCGTAIEFIPTEQWFIKVLDKKKELISQGKKVKWHPEFMRKRYESWVNGLEWDWNISRDRHFGVPIPVWECEKCKKIILPEEKELPVDPLQDDKKCDCGGKGIPEKKVLDTWATSSLSPKIASSKVDGKIKIPYSLRPNGHDIIRTWAFYTIVMSLLHEDKIPWDDIVISGMVSIKGEEMHKSKGNTIEPQFVMEKYGVDALRFWAAGSKIGFDLDYQEKDLVTGKKFVNKIKNATKFVFMNLKNFSFDKQPKLLELDRIFLVKLNKLVKIATDSFKNYNYSRSKLETDNFFWQSFADNYLEIVKKRIYNGTKEEKESAGYVLYHSLLTILKLMAPITPYITEEIYQEFFKKNEKIKSIHLSEWPKELKIISKKNDLEIWDTFISNLSKTRQKKSEAKKSMNSEIVLTIDKKDKAKLKNVLEDFAAVTNSKEINEGKFKVEFT